jgi:hypothetical protein
MEVGSSDNIKKKIEELSDNIKLGKDTILTEKAYSKENAIDNFIHLDIFTGSFLTGIILIIICIVYLFKSNTEYISWIFGLLLLVLLPLTWISNFLKSSNSNYKWYIAFCSFFGIILNFVAILMVVLYTTRLNNRIKEYKSNQILAPGKLPNKYHINKDITDNYQKIKILFTTNLVLCITIIMNFFVYEGEKYKNGKTKIETDMSKNIYWWYDFIQNKILYVDNIITKSIEYIPLHGFIKMFLLFCTGLLFFSFFIKLKTTYIDTTISDPYVQNLVDEFGYGLKGIYPAVGYEIVNFPNILVETAGPVNFAALSSFFLSLMVMLIIYFIILLIKSWKPTLIPNGGTLIIFCGFFLINFLAFYYGNLNNSPKIGGKLDTTSGNILSQNYILFLLCFILSILGTPAIFMIFELIGRIYEVSLAGDLKTYFFPNSTTNICEGKWNDFKFSCANRVFISIILLLISFLGILFGIFSYGANFDGKKTGHWMSNEGNTTQVKLFVIAILSVMVGWFFALHLKFNMFSFIYQSVIQPSRMVLFTFAPLTLLALAITQIALADISSKILGNPVMTDG